MICEILLRFLIFVYIFGLKVKDKKADNANFQDATYVLDITEIYRIDICRLLQISPATHSSIRIVPTIVCPPVIMLYRTAIARTSSSLLYFPTSDIRWQRLQSSLEGL